MFDYKAAKKTITYVPVQINKHTPKHGEARQGTSNTKSMKHKYRCISTKSAKHKSGSTESADYIYISTKSVKIQVRIICRSMKSVKHKYISGQKFEVSWRGKLLLRQNTSTHICSEVDICTSSKYIAESNTDLYFHRKNKYRV